MTNAATARVKRAVAEPLAARPLLSAVIDGSVRPRLAPPAPRRSAMAELRNASSVAGISLMGWQEAAGFYLTATRKGRWVYPEVVVVVARQNGKSTILVPRIVMGLLRGERIMHTAQNRELPRAIYHQVASIMETRFAPALAHRPRYANGQELITMRDGGMYRIVAPNTSGARGYTNDLVIIDEVREMRDFDFIGAARPTLTASPDPQMLYLSNAGDEASVVLNALRKRADADPQLAYLEWSAHPDRRPEDTRGWAEANPALGRTVSLETLRTAYNQLPLPLFETEHLCRWVTTMMPRLVSDVAWQRAKGPVSAPIRPTLGISADPTGRRVSAVMAWMDGAVVNVHTLADYGGSPVDIEGVADLVNQEVRKLGIRQIGFDPWTDRDFARYFKDPKPVQSADYEAACERFVRAVESGQLRYEDEDGYLTADMAYTVRRDTAHGWMAVIASDERPTTASLAAIRAVWLATTPSAKPPQVY